MRRATSWARALLFVALGLAGATTALWASGAAAAPPVTPVGDWKTIDDDGKTAKSVVRIYEKDGKLYGKIVELLKSDPDSKCTECSGARKDKPIVGMVIMWDLDKDDDEWSGGRILDPENGEDYSCVIALEDGGKTLKVRGYVGLSLFGRSQRWHRVARASAPAE